MMMMMVALFDSVFLFVVVALVFFFCSVAEGINKKGRCNMKRSTLVDMTITGPCLGQPDWSPTSSLPMAVYRL